jgi:hypothetical protein
MRFDDGRLTMKSCSDSAILRRICASISCLKGAMNAVSEESANCSLVILICSTFTANFGEQAHKQMIEK